MHVIVTVIEANINHCLGAYIQFLSLKRYPATIEHRVCLVERHKETSAPFIDLLTKLNMVCRPGPTHFKNPYLNKWLILDAFPDLLHRPAVALLDWDVIYCGSETLPISNSLIGARPVSTQAYSNILRNLAPQLPAALVNGNGHLIVSVNAGVLIANGNRLAECAQSTIRWEAVLDNLGIAEAWMREQIAFSFALTENKSHYLHEMWNVTPVSELDENLCQLWHYHDGSVLTRNLKKALIHKHAVQSAIQELRQKWPRVSQRYEELHTQAVNHQVLRGFIQP